MTLLLPARHTTRPCVEISGTASQSLQMWLQLIRPQPGVARGGRGSWRFSTLKVALSRPVYYLNNTEMLSSLSKEDLSGLFLGPEHFFRKRTIWRLTHEENEGQESDPCRPGTCFETCDFNSTPFPSSSSPLSSQPTHHSPSSDPSPNPKDQFQ
ncbi:hypothetical protein KOW79_015921 [Hemibagrus wyckioides]|uniref:Uncharacterized protein n=1 Tax=Hemibagrus wyckioides TaxID=337641 RepID=A0A9D3NF15_9TELE|nr:hypothetical protein KOW79_015921 [Hemibagrus wyckioides]